jgi:hypothetical protein
MDKIIDYKKKVNKCIVFVCIIVVFIYACFVHICICTASYLSHMVHFTSAPGGQL